MRVGIVAAAFALWLAPTAGAAFGPPLVDFPSTLKSIPIIHIRVADERPPSSCIAHARRSTGTVGKIERKLAPVACEQPPRSEIKGTGFGFFFRLNH
jgi:hypothetical protein